MQLEFFTYVVLFKNLGKLSCMIASYFNADRSMHKYQGALNPDVVRREDYRFIGLTLPYVGLGIIRVVIQQKPL